MTTSTLRLPPRIARLPQLRQIVRGGLAARGSVGAGLAAKAGGAAGNGLLTGLVAYWKLDEESGNRADALSVYTMTDQNSVGSSVGKLQALAADFDQVDDPYLRLANPGFGVGPNIDGNFTISAWVYARSLPIAPYYHAIYDSSSDNLGGLLFAINGQAQVFCQVCTFGAGRVHVWHGPTDVTLDTWHFVVAQWVDATKTLHGSFNGGAWYEPRVWDYNYRAAWETDLRIACRSWGAPYYLFDGRLADVGIWSRLLSPTDVANLYNSGAGLAYSAFTA